MKKSILLTTITIVTAITLTACSTGETKNKNVISESQNTASTSISSSESESSNTKDVINDSVSEKDDAVLTVKIHSAASADLSLYNVTIDDNNELIGTWEILIDQYSISLASLGNDELQCSIWNNSNGNGTLVSNIDYTYEDNVLTFYADMSAISGFDFNTVDTYTVYIDSDGRGGPQISVPASEAVAADETTNPSASQGTDSTQSDSNNAYKLSDFAGTYTDSNNNSFTLYDLSAASGGYQFKDFTINHEIYNGTDISSLEMSNVFTDEDVIKDSNGNLTLEFVTQFGCTGKASFSSGNTIIMSLSVNGKTFESTFTKSSKSGDGGNTSKQSYTVSIEGKSLTFPIAAADLISTDWNYKNGFYEKGSSKFQPNSNDGSYIEGNMVAGLRAYDTDCILSLPKGITFGDTKEDIESIYGKTDSIQEYSTEIRYFYHIDNVYLEFDVGADTQTITTIDITVK